MSSPQFGEVGTDPSLILTRPLSVTLTAGGAKHDAVGGRRCPDASGGLAGRLPPGLVRLVRRQQPYNQSDQLACREGNCPLVLMLGHLIVFALVIGCVLSVAHPYGVGSLAEVVTQVGVTTLGQI